MNHTLPIFKREFFGYFRSPIAYVLLFVFLQLAFGLTFFVGRFFDMRSASLDIFFNFLPWVFVFFAPAVGMRLWSEEKRSGTWELLLTLPVPAHATVLAKFLAAWAFLLFGLLLTFPIALTIGYLGDPDWGVVFAGYLAAALMAGAFLALCSLVSSFTANQVIAFVVGAAVCFAMVLLGWSIFADLLEAVFPVRIADAITNFGVMPYFEPMQRGIIGLRELLYFFSIMMGALWLNVVAVER